jgi:hypothetical protein
MQLSETKGYFEANSMEPPLRPEEPRYSGAALWARGIHWRIDRDWMLLAKALYFLGPSKVATVSGDYC